MTRDKGVRIGNQTSFSASSITRPFEFAVENGFGAFEWFPDKRETGEGWEDLDLGSDERESIRRTAAEQDIRLSVHASWSASPLAAENRALLERQADFARQIGAGNFNIHLYAEEGIDPFLDAIAPLVARLSEAGIRLSIENTPAAPPEAFNRLFDAVRVRFGGNRLGMCLDLGHANLCDTTRNDYLRYVDLLAPEVPITHVHLHENYGDADSHLTVFTGPASRDPSGIEGFVARLKRRRFSGLVILEQWPEPPALLIQARDRLVDLFGRSYRAPEPGSAERPARKMHRPKGDASAAEPDRDSRKTQAPADEFVSLLVEGDRENRSWREKLGFVHDLLTGGADLDKDKLAYLAVYLRFVGTGEIRSQEEGGHHRPSHHARMAERIYERLAEIGDEENRFVIRRIHPWLPSFDSAFTRAEPLTRIRDIAHRNDIPGELKREIKTTLQNKLHRNAGPEDLATSRALLERTTAPGAGYPESFVEEFQKFHRELEEFFHAGSLDRDLETLASADQDEDSNLIRMFLEAKKREETPGQALRILELLTRLRSRLADRLRKSEGAEAQQLGIADIRLEDYSFVILSRLAGYFLSSPDRRAALRSLALAVEGLRFSGFDPTECRAVEAELNAAGSGFRPESTEGALRLKAAVERAARFAGDYADRILSLFPAKAETLGVALGVEARAVRLFAEADIRRHPVFPLSKIASALLKEIRKLARISPWDTIVPGRAAGVLIEIPELDAPVPNGQAIALLQRIEGDEEIPRKVAAVIAAHEIPHLSHFAVRARQRNLPLVACEEEDAFRRLAQLAGRRIRIFAGSGSDFEWKEMPDRGDENSQEAWTPETRSVRLPEVDLSAARPLIPFAEITLETGGSKAYQGRRLEELSGRPEADFRVPRGLVVPFGVMEDAIRSDRERERSYTDQLSRMNALSYPDLELAAVGMHDLVAGLKVPDEILAGVRGAFDADQRLMIRSSSNGEDLQALSGAGLYESVAGVFPADAGGAIAKVWASLWTKRAVFSRSDAGIRNEDAHMAVIVEEMLAADLSFILHTRNPVSGNADEIAMELAVGLGETLASAGTRGTPYRLLYNRRSGRLTVLSFASFGKALKDGGGGIREETVDYSRIAFTADEEYRNRLGIRVGGTGRYVTEAFGRPQDIEGVIKEEVIYLVQARPQQGGFDA